MRDNLRMGFRNREGVLSVGPRVAGMTFLLRKAHLSDLKLLWQVIESRLVITILSSLFFLRGSRQRGHLVTSVLWLSQALNAQVARGDSRLN